VTAFVIPIIDQVPVLLLHTSLISTWQASDNLWLIPISKEHASYAPTIIFMSMLVLGGLAFWWLHPKGTFIRRSKMWSCGNPKTHARMQYNATSFSQPMHRIFKGFYQSDEAEEIERPQHKLLTRRVRYTTHLDDLFVKKLYQPMGQFIRWLATHLYREHQRDIHVYMTYSFATILLLFLLFLIHFYEPTRL